MAVWTCDTELDFGGRTNGTLGIKYGLPKILELFRIYNVKGIFFISTELLRENSSIVDQIQEGGHTIASHGHFHRVWKEKWRAKEDRLLAEQLLSRYVKSGKLLYRSPKFSYPSSDTFNDTKNHVGLLKYAWFGELFAKVNDDTIFYLHPFDICHWDKAPNLFCMAWYSNPRGALRTLRSLLDKYGRKSS